MKLPETTDCIGNTHNFGPNSTRHHRRKSLSLRTRRSVQRSTQYVLQKGKAYGYLANHRRRHLPDNRNAGLCASGASRTAAGIHRHVCFHFTDRLQFTPTQLIVWAVIVVLVQVLDYVIPLLGSKYAGGTKWGNWGCVIGTVAGLFFPPWGIIIGPFLGAVVGELLGDKDLKHALKSGFGSLVGFLFGTAVKLALCGYFIWQFIAAF